MSEVIADSDESITEFYSFLAQACEQYEEANIPFVKKPDGGKMKGIAFVKVKRRK